MDRIYRRIEKHTAGLSVFLALLLALMVTGGICGRAEASAAARLQEHLSGEVLRFHVLANSDSEADQEVKLKVRDAVIAYLQEEMPESADAEEAARWVRSRIDRIEELSRETAARNGSDDPVSAAVTTCWFPDRTYGDLTFPAGNYKALRIEIGEGAGHNWWCVLYPGLCFLDSTHAVMPEEGKKKLKNVLTEEEYSRINAGSDFRIGWYFW